MNSPELSIVIVNYRSWDLLRECLRSFQTYPPQLSYEIIVVDNSDQSKEYEAFSKEGFDIRLVKNYGNCGFAHGCNFGAEHSSGEYILFLNPDTQLTEDNALDVMVTFARSNEDVGIVSCRNVTPKGVGKEYLFLNPWVLLIPLVRQIYKLLNRKKINEEYPKSSNVWYPGWIPGSVVLIHSDFFHEIGRWNEERFWMYHEDPDLSLKAKKKGKKVALLRDVSIAHIEGGTSRQTPETTVRSKTEVIISAHNYIQIHTRGIERILLHAVYIAKTVLSNLLMMVLYPLFWSDKFKIKALLLYKVVKYYLSALKRSTWKSERITCKSTTGLRVNRENHDSNLI